MDRRTWLLVSLGLFAAPLAAGAQPGKVARVGFLASQSVTPESLEAFGKGLRELGWIEGQNLALEAPGPPTCRSSSRQSSSWS